MNFKLYDILSSLIPGILVYVFILNLFEIPFNNDFIIPATAISFVIGFMINTFSSWLEDFYYLTWGGTPSTKLLQGKDIWKVRFYHVNKVKTYLLEESGNPNASEEELFSLAKIHSSGNERVNDFNAAFAFSRSLLTTVLILSILTIVEYYTEPSILMIIPPTIFLFWLRSKQRGYYYAREVLNVYLAKKNNNQN
jgi:hypothetical protein